MNWKKYWQLSLIVPVIGAVMLLAHCGSDSNNATPVAADVTRDNSVKLTEEGKQTFRFDTFGDEAFWGDALKLHQAIEGSTFAGGVGAGVSPKTALAVGLKVDVDALPQDLIDKLKNGTLDLNNPANTVALIKLNAVLGITGFFNADGSMKSMGIQCAFCHSTVDDSLAAGIGHRLDGWANQDLNVGAIIALAPNLQPVVDVLKPELGAGLTQDNVRDVIRGWGPGKFDAQLFLDGKTAKPGGLPGSSATLIPAAYGLTGVNLHTSTGWGSVTYWNAFVAVLEMHGQGTFVDSRLRDAKNADGTPQFPVALANGFDNVRPANNGPDLVTSKLAALQFYQLALAAPAAPATAFDAARAASGKTLFVSKGCARCHVPPLFTEPGWNMHTAAEIGIDDFQANRSPDRRYRTSPLKGIWVRETRPAAQKRGFFHDGRFTNLLDVVNHYNTFLALGLTDTEKGDLVEYMKSL